MRESLERAYEAGRTAGILEMANRNNIISGLCDVQSVTFDPPLKPIKTVITRVKKGGAAASIAKFKKAARTAKSLKPDTKPRTKGVKEALLKLLGDASEALTAAEIISISGLKATSVRATLMNLKKKGFVDNTAGLWQLIGPASGAGNSDAEHAPL
jgi:hypothetical protein